MFKLFKRSPAPAQPPARPARAPQGKPTAKPPHARAALGDPPPLPEVTEGNDATDWDLWESSMMSLDSQLQGLTPTQKIYVKDEPSAFDDLDAFSRVGKNRDI